MLKQKMYNNPILPGFYPDPSICRVGDDFYMVNSTFSYFPGIPVSHSKDLVNWQQIGNVIHRPEQLERENIKHSYGIFAPTIRYNNGVYYVLCTHVHGKGNFIVKAENPAGPWSDPYWLDAEGIDPSLFFDDDGSAWYCGTKEMPEPAYFGDNQIYIQQLDLNEMKLLGESSLIWRTALKEAVWPEGPHLYKKGDWYYLIYAEGGTSIDHAVCSARARTLSGPWEGNKKNPILTHRHLHHNTPIINVGHADIVDDPKGNWWMICLASRPYGSQGSYNLGRETFLIPLSWADEWPWPSPKTGMVEEKYPFPDIRETPVINEPACDHFESSSLPLHWLSLQSNQGLSRLFERPGYLRIAMCDPGLRNPFQAGFAGRRQRHMSWNFSCRIEFSPQKGDRAGIALVQNHDYQYRMEIIKRSENLAIRLIKASGSEDKIIEEAELSENNFNREDGTESLTLILYARANGQRLSFYYGKNSYSLTPLSTDQEGDILSTTQAGGFVGNVLGIFATSINEKKDHYADFAWVEYQGLS